MRKIIAIIIVLVLVIPNLAIASWWNPSTWNIFRKAENQTEVLEKRIKELESKINNFATTTSTASTPDVGATTTTQINSVTHGQPSTTKPTITKTTPQSTIKVENFAMIVVDAMNSQIKLNQDLANYIDQIIANVNTNVEKMTSLRDKTRVRFNESGGESELAKLLLDVYIDRVNYFNSFSEQFVFQKNKLNRNTDFWRDIAYRASSSFINREEAIDLLQKINNSPIRKNISNDVDKSFEEYKTELKRDSEDMEDIFMQLELKYGRNLDSTLPTYTPTQIPQIQAPQRNSTYCNVYTNTISCDTYSY